MFEIEQLTKVTFPLDINCLGKVDPRMRKLISFNVLDLIIVTRNGLSFL